MSTLEDRIRAIEDREAILELTASYCHRARGGDDEGIVDLFCDDGVMESGETRAEGRDALLALYRETLPKLRPMPCVHNHMVSLAGDRATGTCSVEVRMALDGVAITASGHYEDVYRRDGDGWRFESRNLVMYHQVPHREGWADDA